MLAALGELVAEKWPDGTLEKNRVGNLSVISGDTYVGWLDLHSFEIGEVRHPDIGGCRVEHSPPQWALDINTQVSRGEMTDDEASAAIKAQIIEE